jgi:hypothetical protein
VGILKNMDGFIADNVTIHGKPFSIWKTKLKLESDFQCTPWKSVQPPYEAGASAITKLFSAPCVKSSKFHNQKVIYQQ